MYTLASLDQLHRDLDIPTAETSQDARLIACIEAASRALEQFTGRHFTPFKRVLAHTLPRDPTTLILDDDLLELTQVRDGGGVLAPDTYTLWPPEPPYSLLTLRDGRVFSGDGGTRPITVEGLWGWHDSWRDAFRATGDWVRDTPLLFDAPLLHVGSASAADAQGDPYFPVGALLRIGAGSTAEYTRVTAVNAATQALTLRRADQGTSSSTAAFGTVLFTYQTPRLALEMARTWAARRFLRISHDDAPSADGVSPADDLREQAAMLRRVGVSAW